MNERQLTLLANAIRQDVIKSLAAAGKGHTADSLGTVDILTGLYFNALAHKPRQPHWSNRDRVLVSNSHITPAIYATLAHAGYFAKKHLLTLSKHNSLFHGRAHDGIPGIDATGDANVAVGMALAAKLDNNRHHTYCILSDEQHNNGATWEALLFAAKHKLNNLTFIIDRNHIQPGGYTENVMPLEPLRDKYEAFNWHVIEVDGHNITHIIDALHDAKTIHKPTAIIAHTIPGKGVSFIENDYTWHAKAPTHEQAAVALAELEHQRRAP